MAVKRGRGWGGGVGVVGGWGGGGGGGGGGQYKGSLNFPSQFSKNVIKDILISCQLHVIWRIWHGRYII